MAIIAFLSRSPGLLNRGPGGPASLGHVPHSSIFSPTDWTSCALSYIIIWRPNFFLRASQFRTQFNPSTVKVISWYSSTGCTCYLHWCISYFDSLAGSEVNIQHCRVNGHLVYAVMDTKILIFIKEKMFWCKTVSDRPPSIFKSICSGEGCSVLDIAAPIKPNWRRLVLLYGDKLLKFTDFVHCLSWLKKIQTMVFLDTIGSLHIDSHTLITSIIRYSLGLKTQQH